MRVAQIMRTVRAVRVAAEVQSKTNESIGVSDRIRTGISFVHSEGL